MSVVMMAGSLNIVDQAGSNLRSDFVSLTCPGAC